MERAAHEAEKVAATAIMRAIDLYDVIGAFGDKANLHTLKAAFEKRIGVVSVLSETVSRWNAQRRQETAFPTRETDEANSLCISALAPEERLITSDNPRGKAQWQIS